LRSLVKLVRDRKEQERICGRMRWLSSLEVGSRLEKRRKVEIEGETERATASNTCMFFACQITMRGETKRELSAITIKRSDKGDEVRGKGQKKRKREKSRDEDVHQEKRTR